MDLVSKIMSLLFNMLSRLIIDFLARIKCLLNSWLQLVMIFLPRSKCLLISWLQPPSTVILEPRKIKFVTVTIVSPSICHEVMGPDDMILVSEC